MLLIRDVLIPARPHFTRAHIIISREGRIVGLKKSEYVRYFMSRVEEIYNARGMWALPGLIDMHVHFREPGQKWKEDFTSGSIAALAGGVCVVADMPNNVPPTNTLERLSSKLAQVRGKSYVDFILWAGLPESPGEAHRILNSIPVPGFKVYMPERAEMRRFLSLDYPRDSLYVVHAEHPDMLRETTANDYETFERSRPAEAEAMAIEIVGRLALKRGYSIHITHVSSRLGLSTLCSLRRKGVKVTADVTPHHLILTKRDGQKIGARAKCVPPLRDDDDRRELLKAVLRGEITCIASDHAPHTAEEKCEFSSAPAGIASVEFLLTLIYSLARKAHVDFLRLLEATTRNPARILKLKNRGWLKVGNWADIVIFDPREKWIIREDEMFSRAGNTPYHGMLVRGKVRAVFVRGRLAFEDGNVVSRVGTFAYEVV